MLDETDTEIVSRWLRDALALGESNGKTQAELARHCRVTPQAVNGWLSTGRISKSNLAMAAAFFGHAPRFDSAAETAQEPPAAYGDRWPFDHLDAVKISALPRDDLLRLEGAFLLAAAQLGFRLAKEAAA